MLLGRDGHIAWKGLLTCNTQTPGKKNWRAKFLLPSGDSFLTVILSLFLQTSKNRNTDIEIKYAMWMYSMWFLWC